ncbi:hypothetical protein VB638_12690 [Dolichospermum sp. UHCC 0684]|jgi:hypothetical protein|uniref:Uncharacterized protein n=1 Tax=Dolichospermum flos-aquae CCAP 1403/13F TaxID=315271 RepID=A0A6H2BWI5_DOLFA|nr:MULTISPECIES: hypothetical protein [Dolichospermum]MEA5530431.1 hypothetical protein [Dolichospermum sp. UHCC 0684]MTJ33711.1 hypothetical protein [Dolichospermum sp. UHCC 0260]QJB43069.1 hypothetical protein HGD76_01280 [Dolichospermum flos-aquae CCAP 1403/13F]
MRTIRHLTKVSTLTGVALTSLLVSSPPVAAQRACVVTDSGNVVCGRLQQNSQKPSSAKNQTVEFEHINVTLQGCKRSSSTVNCHFLLTAKQDSDVSFICRESKMFDVYGSEYFCKQAQIGKSKEEGSPNTRMLKGIPLKAIATFKEVPTQVKEIAAIEVKVNPYVDYQRYYNAVFRSIPISE